MFISLIHFTNLVPLLDLAKQVQQRIRELRNKISNKPREGLVKFFKQEKYETAEQRAAYIASLNYKTECRQLYKVYEPVSLVYMYVDYSSDALTIL